MSTKTGIILGISVLAIAGIGIYLHKRAQAKKEADAIAEAAKMQKIGSGINAGFQTGAFNVSV